MEHIDWESVKDFRHRVGQKPLWSTFLKAYVPDMYMDHLIILLLSTWVCDIGQILLPQFYTTMLPNVILTQVLLSDIFH